MDNVENSQMVALSGDKITIMLPHRFMTKRQALELAAWLVAMSDHNDEFSSILEAVQNG